MQNIKLTDGWTTDKTIAKTHLANKGELKILPTITSFHSFNGDFFSENMYIKYILESIQCFNIMKIYHFQENMFLI